MTHFTPPKTRFTREAFTPLEIELLSKTAGLEPSIRLMLYHAFCGKSYDAIAKEMGLCVGTVKSRINRARHKLKNAVITGRPRE